MTSLALSADHLKTTSAKIASREGPSILVSAFDLLQEEDFEVNSDELSPMQLDQPSQIKSMSECLIDSAIKDIVSAEEELRSIFSLKSKRLSKSVNISKRPKNPHCFKSQISSCRGKRSTSKSRQSE